MEDLRAWARQPTTIAGISAVIATLSALALSQLTWPQAVPVLVGAVTSMLLPDNTDVRRQAQQLASDVVSSLTQKKV